MPESVGGETVKGWLWVGFAIAATVVLGMVERDIYQAGQASMASTIKTLTDERDTAQASNKTLAGAILDMNAKVKKFEADLKPDVEQKLALQDTAKVEAVKSEARVKAATAVTGTSDDVLRKYWESYAQ